MYGISVYGGSTPELITIQAFMTRCVTHSTDCYQRITLKSWYTNLQETPLHRCKRLPGPYKRLIDDINETEKQLTNHTIFLTVGQRTFD